MNNNNPIRVLEVFGRMNRGGAEAMIMNLYRHMDRSQVQLDFMVHTEEHCQYDDEIEQLGGHIYHIPRLTNILDYSSYVKAWRTFFYKHPEHHVVHGHMGATAAIYLHEANRAGRYTIAHSHYAGTPHTLFHLKYSILSYPTRYIANQLFGCSTEAGIVRFGAKSVNGGKYRNFPNAIDLHRFEFDEIIRQQKRKELGIRENQIVIISVGRIAHQKNPALLFNIFKEIVTNNSDAYCVWVGTGKLEDEYRTMIKSERLENRINMTGVRPDIPDLLMAADVFLFPSFWEGLPVSVIEAQATGLPCILSDTISHEVEVSPLVEWHTLDEPVNIWAERCVALANKYKDHRQSPVDDIRSAGYDVEESAKWLQNFYLKHSEI